MRVEGNEKDPMSAKCPDQSRDKKCLPRIAGVSVNGELTIQFPFPIKTFKKEFYQNITKDLRINLIKTNQTSNNTILRYDVTDFQP